MSNCKVEGCANFTNPLLDICWYHLTFFEKEELE